MFKSQSGDIYLIRNIPELNATKMSYWQHAAIAHNGYIIEGQAEPGQVIMVTEEAFRNRNPEHIVLRPIDSAIGKAAGLAAMNYLGTKYNAKTFNCVTLVRKSYSDAGKSFLWLMPDGISKCSFFTVVEKYSDYKNWKQPADWYEGRII